ncbi:MAG: tetratricopeptide repeat protein [Parabacteroides merdae]
MGGMLKSLISISFLLFLIGSPQSLRAQDQEAKVEISSKPNKVSAGDQRKFDYFFYEGLNLKAAGKFDAAYDAFNHCLAIDSTASAVLYELSSFYARLDRPEKSLEMLRRAVAYSSDNFTYRLALATMSRNLGMFGEASDEYEKLVKDYPGKPELNYYLADALTQEGEIGKAIDAYDALRIVHRHERGAFQLQKYKLYNALEQNDNAFKEVEKLAAKFPMESRYQIILGDLHLEKNDTVKALKYYQKAHEIDPESPYYIVSMATLL